MKKTIIALVGAVVAGLPVGWFLAMALTPIFWWLESILHVELAGHSGPSDWLMFVVMGVTVCVIFFIFRRVLSSPRS